MENIYFYYNWNCLPNYHNTAGIVCTVLDFN